MTDTKAKAKRILAEDKAVIRRLYQEGVSLKDIGQAVGGVTKQAISYHVQKMGLEAPPDTERLEMEALAEELLGSEPDMSIKDLAEYLECSWDIAKRVMTDLEFYEEPVPFIDRIDAQKLTRLYVVEDKSLADLAEMFGNVSELTLSKTLKELGVPMRPQGASTGDIREEWRKEAMQKLNLCEQKDINAQGGC